MQAVYIMYWACLIQVWLSLHINLKYDSYVRIRHSNANAKTGPFGNRPSFDHLKTKHIWFSDPHCTQLTFIRLSESKQRGKHGDYEEIDVEVLNVVEVGQVGVEDQSRHKHGERVSGHVLENAERSDQCATT